MEEYWIYLAKEARVAHLEVDKENEQINIYVPVEQKDLKSSKIKCEKWEEELNNYPVRVIPVSMLSREQNALIHIIFQQFAEQTGDTRENIKVDLKNEFCRLKEIPVFSFERAGKDVLSMELAGEYINWLIEKALQWDVDLFFKEKGTGKIRHVRHFIEEIDRYVIACLRERKCAICNLKHDPENGDSVDLEHWDNVNTIGGYEFDDGLKTRFIPLCRVHHNEKHDMGRKEFEETYHLKGVWLNEKLVFDLLETYKNHFKLFRKEMKDGKYDYLKRREE